MEIKDELMIDILRDGALESQHLGSLAVVDFYGSILAKVGNPYRRTFIRSSAKPMQAIPTFADDACMRRFKFTSRERAYMTGSNNGERRHQEIGAHILEKLGLEIKHLKCGIHPPVDEQTADEMRKNGEPFTPLCHNCAGNHLVMLALSVHRGWPIANYTNPEHPYQKEVLKWISMLSSVPKNLITIGADGCTAPVYQMTLRELALCFARFGKSEELISLSNPDKLDIERGAKAMRQVIDDYWAHPEIMGGRNRFDTFMNTVGRGKFFAKGGGEGFQLAGVADDGIGIAIKIIDGDPLKRARCTSLLEAMHQLGIISDNAFHKAVKERLFYKPLLPNQRGAFDLEIKPKFKVTVLHAWKKRFG